MPSEFSMADAIRFAVAVLVTASGVLSLLLCVARIRKRDYALFYFGWGATIYGVRFFLEIGHRSGGIVDLALTLLLPIPIMLLMVELAAVEWKKIAQWIAIGLLGVAILLMSLRLLLQPGSRLPSRINNFIVLTLIPLWVTMAFFPRRPFRREMQILRAGLVVFLLFVLYTNLFWLRLLPGSGDLELSVSRFCSAAWDTSRWRERSVTKSAWSFFIENWRSRETFNRSCSRNPARPPPVSPSPAATFPRVPWPETSTTSWPRTALWAS